MLDITIFNCGMWVPAVRALRVNILLNFDMISAILSHTPGNKLSASNFMML